MPQSIFVSNWQIDDIGIAIRKIKRLDNIAANAFNISKESPAKAYITMKEDSYLYEFWIPAGLTGKDLFLQAQKHGYQGSEDKFYMRILELLHHAIPYEHIYLKRYTHEEMQQFTHQQLLEA
ncbi:MAG: hypothetical protein LBJ12_01420 [Oscillospiraceae bacterium]|jgi:hypothetical protein|nr:hypothetical protein [Oscillospiraceae bacterium]